MTLSARRRLSLSLSLSLYIYIYIYTMLLESGVIVPFLCCRDCFVDLIFHATGCCFQCCPSFLTSYFFDCKNMWFSHNLELVTDATDAADATEVVSSTAARTPLPRAPGAREHEWGKPEVQTETIWQMHGIPRIPA